MKRLSSREREIMGIIFRLGEASTTQIESEMDNPPKNATVRSALRNMVDKGHILFRKEGREFIYFPTEAKESAQQKALGEMVSTFFQGSPKTAIAALIELNQDIDSEELDELSRLIERTRSK